MSIDAPANALSHSGFKALPPCRCLLPADVAELVTDGLEGVVLASQQEVPSLSDRVATLHCKDFQDHERLVQELLWRLSDALDLQDEPLLFVLLVPSAAAGAVIGTKGQKVKELCASTGAEMDVSREVLQGLQAQPVTIRGSLSQVVAGSVGVQRVIGELFDKGRLGPENFRLQVTAGTDLSDLGDHCGESLSVCSVPPTPSSSSRPGRISSAGGCSVVILMSMESAGRVLGRQGRTAADVEQETGAKVRVQNSGSNLPGLRCGDRLVEIHGSEQSCLEALRVVWCLAVAATAGQHGPMLLVPESAVGFIIGKGGESLREVTSKCAVDMNFQTSLLVAGARPLAITGAGAEKCAAAAVVVAQKLVELKRRHAPQAAQSAPAARASARADVSVVSGYSCSLASECGGDVQSLQSHVGQVFSLAPGGRVDHGAHAFGPCSGGSGGPEAPPWRCRNEGERAVLEAMLASGAFLDSSRGPPAPQFAVDMTSSAAPAEDLEAHAARSTAGSEAASHYAASHYTADLRPPASSSSLCLATG
eukprot:TRINITY_DN34138_c1_g3_i1.p1 TRINITY_DN34138_c1_g3~~TRINITY_DN34138_c1_g3_i1.p1  ORF type:complete len:535 (+),score=107.23 TRINITY_DN34138_c1_g3_i1:180-1784(+)